MLCESEGLPERVKLRLKISTTRYEKPARDPSPYQFGHGLEYQVDALVAFESSHIEESGFGKAFSRREGGEVLEIDAVRNDLDSPWNPAPHEILGRAVGDGRGRYGSEHPSQRPLQEPGR